MLRWTHIIYRLSFLLMLLPFDASPQISLDVPFNVCLPLPQIRVTSGFGLRVHPVAGKPDFHQGVDLSAHNDPVFSIMAGTICKTGSHPILGNYVRINHGAVQSIYGHLSFILIEAGQVVEAGQLIGITGGTGRTTGEHLHFSVRSATSYIHPLRFLKAVMEQQAGLSVY